MEYQLVRGALNLSSAILNMKLPDIIIKKLDIKLWDKNLVILKDLPVYIREIRIFDDFGYLAPLMVFENELNALKEAVNRSCKNINDAFAEILLKSMLN